MTVTAGDVVVFHQRLGDDVREALRALKADAEAALVRDGRPGRGKPRRDYEYHLLATYLHALTQKGWTQTSISDALGLSRQRVGQLIERDFTPVTVSRLPLPSPPVKPEPERSPKPPLLSDYEVHRLQELGAIKAKRRANAGPDHPTTKAMVAYLDLVEAAWDRGVSTYMMAKQTGFSHGSFAQALMRRGRVETPPSLVGGFRPLDKVEATPTTRAWRPDRRTNDVMLTKDTVHRLRTLFAQRRLAQGRVTKGQYTVMIEALVVHLYRHDGVPTRVMAEQTGLSHPSLERAARKRQAV